MNIFDNFNNGIINPSLWTVLQKDSTATVVDGQVKIAGTGYYYGSSLITKKNCE